MRVYLKLIVSFLFLISMCVLTSAQECREILSNVEPKVQKIESFDTKQYEGWNKINIPNKISFYAPEDVEKVEIENKGNHSTSSFLKFKGKDFIIDGEFSASAYKPSTYFKNLPSFCEWYSSIDGASAYFWHFTPNKRSTNYESGIYFQFKEDKNYHASLYLKSENKDTKEVAEKIFKSITFLKIPSTLTSPPK